MLIGRPYPHLYACGKWGFKVIPRKGQATVGELFRLDHTGLEQIVWRRALINTPCSVRLHPFGYQHDQEYSERMYVVTHDNHGSAHFSHALVVYNHLGDVTADLSVPMLLTDAEIERQYVGDLLNVSMWACGADIYFREVNDQPELHLCFDWGKVLSVRLDTAEIIQHLPPKS